MPNLFIRSTTAASLLVAASLFLSLQSSPRAEETETISWPDSPEGVLRCLELAYEGRSTEDYAALFTADFRFHFGDPELRQRYPDGWAREDEIASADHLFHGFVNRLGVALPAARTIQLALDPFLMSADPEKPDSSDWYRVAMAPRVVLVIDFGARARISITDQPHAFWLVRGDVAVLPGGARGDAGRWFVRRWVEHPNSRIFSILASRDTSVTGETSISADSETQGGRIHFGELAVWPNPSANRISVRFALEGPEPARLALIDVAGRVRRTWNLEQLGEGRHSYELGSSVAPDAGVYWLRLTQGGRAVTRRVILTGR